MRDLERIDRILEKIKKLWDKHPDQRFFQLLFNYTRLQQGHEDGKVRDPFYYEDDDIEADLDNVLEEVEE